MNKYFLKCINNPTDRQIYIKNKNKEQPRTPTGFKLVAGLEPPAVDVARAEDHDEPGAVRDDGLGQGLPAQLVVRLVVRVLLLLPLQVDP